MNTVTQTLLNKINTKLKDTPLIYFTRDPERALGLENVLNNYHIVCIEDSPIVDSLIKKGTNVFCLNKEGVNLEVNSSLNLLNHPRTQEFVKNLTKGEKFFAQFFQFSNPIVSKIEELNGVLVNNNATLNRLFETKLNQFKILQENNIPMPKGKILESSKVSYKELVGEFGESFVIQIDRAHTGAGTFFIRSEQDWQNFVQDYNGNIIKITEYLSGEPFTINGCVTENGVFVAGLQYQITGYKELTSGEGSTVGNDWSYPASQLPASSFDNVHALTQKIGEIMKAKGYRGMFGVDLILKDESWYVIEINARQTANISMQTKLELMQDQVPLSLLHLAEFMNITFDIQYSKFGIRHLEGSQVFLRAKNDLTIQKEIKSGVYRLQSDNTARSSERENVIHTDEEGDMPLIWQNQGYCIDDIKEGGFVILGQKANSKKKKFEEIARMQFKTQIIHNGKVLPWILQGMKAIEEILT